MEFGGVTGRWAGGIGMTGTSYWGSPSSPWVAPDTSRRHPSTDYGTDLAITLAEQNRLRERLARKAAEDAAEIARLEAERARSELEALKQKEAGPMEFLWRVYIVTKKREILTPTKETVVAPDADAARFEAGVDETLRKSELRPRDVTVICKQIGEVAVEKEPERVIVQKTE